VKNRLLNVLCEFPKKMTRRFMLTNVLPLSESELT
jgi:hypothetical protein